MLQPLPWDGSFCIPRQLDHDAVHRVAPSFLKISFCLRRYNGRLLNWLGAAENNNAWCNSTVLLVPLVLLVLLEACILAFRSTRGNVVSWDARE